MWRRALAATAVAAGLGAVAFFKGVRPWYLRWGATDEEVTRPMPLDEHVTNPNLASTMAITIAATPDEIWPWLAQMGDPPRAGYYSYTWIERMVGLRIENAGRLLPQFQTLRVGEALDRNGTMRVLAVEPGRHLVLGPLDSLDTVRVTWAFTLTAIGERATRLATRVRGRWSYRRMLQDTPLLTWPFWLLIEPGAFLMERKMLYEIKRLAEPAEAAAPASDVKLVAASVARFLRLAASGTMRLRRDRLGQVYGIDQGGVYEVFRETVSDDGTPDTSSVLVVGFRLRLLHSIAVLHRLFQRACLLTTPFWSGFRGFRVKLWMVDPTTKNYLGIYDWAGAVHARTYADALVRVLRPLSTPGSVWYELYPDQELEPFLRPRRR